MTYPQILEILASSRALERLLIVSFSGVSLVLGWNLFRAGILTEQQAEFAAKHWSIRLQRVGPGVFFALFAVVGFVFSLAHPFTLNYKDLDLAGGASPQGRNSSYSVSLLSDEAGSLEKDILSITTLERFALPALKINDENQRNAIQQAATDVAALKRQLLIKKFSQEPPFTGYGQVTAFEGYEEIKRKSLTIPTSLLQLKPDELQRYQQMDKLAIDTLLSEKGK